MNGLIMRTLLALALLGAATDLYAGTLAGVTLPDTVQAGSTSLQLNGMGLRTKFMVKVYVAGLYLPHKSSDPNAILKADTAKRVVMHFVRDVSKNQLTDGFAESFHNNTPDAEKAEARNRSPLHRPRAGKRRRGNYPYLRARKGHICNHCGQRKTDHRGPSLRRDALFRLVRSEAPKRGPEEWFARPTLIEFLSCQN